MSQHIAGDNRTDFSMLMNNQSTMKANNSADREELPADHTCIPVAHSATSTTPFLGKTDLGLPQKICMR